MTEYSKHKRDGDAWYSPPFYTGPGGYKLCLSVNANGLDDGAGTHVSVYVNLMRGEHDDKLTWPFRGDITIRLVNQNRDQNHFEECLELNDELVATGGRALSRVTSQEKAESGWGIPNFISHTEVDSTASTKQYLKNDCIKFRVTKVAV